MGAKICGLEIFSPDLFMFTVLLFWLSVQFGLKPKKLPKRSIYILLLTSVDIFPSGVRATWVITYSV